MRALVARKRIRSLTAVSIDDLLSLAWCGQCGSRRRARADGRHRCRCGRATAANQRPGGTAFEVHRAGLAEAFSELTQEAA